MTLLSTNDNISADQLSSADSIHPKNWTHEINVPRYNQSKLFVAIVEIKSKQPTFYIIVVTINIFIIILHFTTSVSTKSRNS